MANVTNLSKGSKGDEVVKLQNALIDAGYDVGSTGADGSFGAIGRSYQCVGEIFNRLSSAEIN